MKREAELKLGVKTESSDEEYLADSAWEREGTEQKNQDLGLFQQIHFLIHNQRFPEALVFLLKASNHFFSSN